MIRTGRFLLTAVLCLGMAGYAADLETLRGTCSISPGFKPGHVDLRLERAGCAAQEHCGSTQTGVPIASFSGLSITDFARDGERITAKMAAEAGVISCAGTVRESRISGDYTFTPNAGFVDRMRGMGYTGFDSEKLQAYTIFNIKSSWIESLKNAGLDGMTVDNVIALHIFGAEPAYIADLRKLGFTGIDADKLIALKVHKVTPAEVKEVQRLGYKPTLDELVQLRIFKITPDFIERMRARGLKDLSISKLVQIKIFNLAE